MRTVSLVMLFVGAAISFNTSAASFDCAKTSTKVEKMICGDIELSARDSTLAIFYKRAMNVSADKEQLKQEQRAWLKEVARCQDSKCVKTHYYSRINALADIALSSITPICANEYPATSLICSDQGLQQQYSQYIELYKTKRNLNSNGDNKWRIDNYFYKTIEEIQFKCVDAECANKKLTTLIDFTKYSIRDLEIANTHAYMPKWKPKLIASGVQHTCVAGDDVIKCWGTPGLEVLTPPRTFKGITQLVSSYSTLSCARDSSGWACWGYCGDGTCDIPGDMKDADKLVTGESHVCGLKNKKIKCWGKNNYGQISVPNDLSDVIDIATDITHTCVILNNGDIECWGGDRHGQVSDGKKLKNAKDIYAGSWFTCIKNNNDKHECTNIVHNYKEGSIFSTKQNIFLHENTFTYFSVGAEKICGITKNNSYVCWPEENLKAPELILNDHSLYAISFDGHMCVLSNKYGISCWGKYENENPSYYKFPYDAKKMMLKTLHGE